VRVNILNTHCLPISPSTTSRPAFQSCTLDYDARRDHDLLDTSGLIPVLEGYLAVPIPTIRTAAWALLDSLLPHRPPTAAAAPALLEPSAGGGRVHARVLGLVFRQLELTVGASSSSSSSSSLSHPESLVVAPIAPWALSPEATGLVLPHVPLAKGTTFAFWLFRARKEREQQQEQREQELREGEPPPVLNPGDRVMRGPDWCDGDEDGWVGNVGTVMRMETSTQAIVEWDGRREQEQFIYRCVSCRRCHACGL